jgi:hypothetical protein
MKKSYQARNAFTLLELTISMLMGLAAGGMIMTLFQQQLTFLTILRTQNFLVEDAPIISNYINQIVGKADSFRIHGSLTAAENDTAPSLGPASALSLRFRLPDGTERRSILYFVPPVPATPTVPATTGGLFLRSYNAAGVVNPDVQLYSSSAISTNVTFSIAAAGTYAGVLQVNLTGPRNESVIYAGTMQQ